MKELEELKEALQPNRQNYLYGVLKLMLSALTKLNSRIEKLEDENNLHQ